MEAFRKIISNPQGSITVELPRMWQYRAIEVLVLPIEETPGGEKAQTGEWPTHFFSQVVGAWAGDPLVRAPQGDFEARRSLD